MKKNANKGFSLVELIIVIAIMAVLVGVLAPQFIKYVESSRQSTDIQNVEAVKTAVETYVTDNLITEGTITITVGSSGATVAVGTAVKADGVVPATTIADECAAVGLTDTSGVIKFKSGGWTAGVATYSTSNFKWTETTAFAANSKNPSKDLKTVFGF